MTEANITVDRGRRQVRVVLPFGGARILTYEYVQELINR